MKSAVLIVTFNSESVIQKCLDSIVRQKIDQILIIDNASSDNTVKLIEQKYPQIKLLKLNKNHGYAGGNNIGIEFSFHNYNFEKILILNPDTYLLSDAVTELFNSSRKYPRSIIGPKIYSDKFKTTIWSAGGIIDKKRYTAGLINFEQKAGIQIQKCAFISGTAMLVPRELLKNGLRFYEPYFMYYEDVEFCLKAGKLGYPSHTVFSAEIVHLETSKSGPKIKNYYLARNHLLFVERNAPFRVKLREAIRFPKTILDHIKNGDAWSIKGIGDFCIGKFGQKYEK